MYKCEPGPAPDPEDPYPEYDWNDGDNGQLLWARNCDFYGNDIRRVQSSDEDCGGLCIADSKCTHFTWGEGGYCYLKIASKFAEIRLAKGAVCGYITKRNINTQFHWQDGDNGKVTWAHGCEFSGNEIRHVRSRGEDCGRLCLSHSRCTHFNWESKGNCYLKTAQNPAANVITYDGICGWVNDRIENDK